MTQIICPQQGPQTDFLATLADIAIMGGAAGGGKSFGLLLEPLRHAYNPVFAGMVFRRNTTHIRNLGGLLDESRKLYPLLGATCRELELLWTFPGGMRMKFAHLEYESTVLDYQGAQIPYIGFDELTHFTEQQFWYMLSRNRSTSGVRGYMRATTNPDADSWVRKLIAWWIDEKTGLAIPNRSGRIRWFIRLDNELLWADTKEELLVRYGAHQQPKSLTFIAAKLSDNKILTKQDPGYLANLMALGRVDRERLLGGNWNVRFSAGAYFRREYFPIVGALSNVKVLRTVRYWDRAATKPTEQRPDPDWTVGVKLGKLTTGNWVVLDVVRLRDTPLKVEERVKLTAQQDGYICTVGIEQDPGSAGVADVDNMVRKLGGFRIEVCKPTKAKGLRAKPVSAQAERQGVCLIQAPWNDSFLAELENFGDDGSGHDDQVDALSGAFNLLEQSASILDVL